jgi:group I intron endonuclease
MNDIFNIEDIAKLKWGTTGIYCISFSNGKCYVGQAVCIRKRLHRHFYETETGVHINKKLSRAINKYRSEIQLEILDICNRKDLNEKELYYINKLDSINNGYNLVIPGEFPKITEEGYKKIDKARDKNKIKVKRYNKITGDFIKEYNSLAEAAKETGESRQNIRLVCRLNSEVVTRSLGDSIYLFSKDCVEGKKYIKEKDHRDHKQKEYINTPGYWKGVNVYNKNTKTSESVPSIRQASIKYKDEATTHYLQKVANNDIIYESANYIFYKTKETLDKYLKNKI